MELALKDYQKLVKATPELKNGTLVGCRAVNYATFGERLKASRKGRKSPAEMLNDPVQKNYLEDKAKKLKQSVNSILGLYGGLVPSFRPLHAKYLCSYFKATSVLDFTSGWGGRLLGAVSLGCRYIGIDSNTDLKEGYERLVNLSGGEVTMFWQPAETVDFTDFEYDFIITSPPFEYLETYQNMPVYEEWVEEFLIPVTKRAFQSLKQNGNMALCIPEKLANIISSEIGDYQQIINLPIRSRTKGEYAKTERVFCWHKT